MSSGGDALSQELVPGRGSPEGCGPWLYWGPEARALWHLLQVGETLSQASPSLQMVTWEQVCLVYSFALSEALKDQILKINFLM